MKKEITIVAVGALILFIGWAVWVFFLSAMFEKSNLLPAPTALVDISEQLSCAEYSCAQLLDAGTRLKEYHYCLVDCTKSYIKVEEGNYAVVAPAGYELLAKAHLEDLQNCQPLLSDLWGMTPEKNIYLATFVQSDKNRAYADAVGIYYYKTLAALQSELKRLENGRGIGVQKGRCLNAHELTHVFTDVLKLPHWANEGLATYAEWQLANEKPPIECLNNGWRYVQGSNQAIKLYANLNSSWSGEEDASQLDWYNSAACVFDFIVARLKPDTLVDILTNFQTATTGVAPEQKIGSGLDRFSTQTFMIKGIAPVVGDTVLVELKARFGL